MASVSQIDPQLKCQVRPHLGTCLVLGTIIVLSTSAILRNYFVFGSYSRSCIGIELALSYLSEAAGSYWPSTDSAANHYGLLRAENPRPISVFCGPCSAPRIFWNLWIGE